MNGQAGADAELAREKTMTEIAKLKAEASKTERERQFYPVIVGATVLFAFAAIAKAFFNPAPTSPAKNSACNTPSRRWTRGCHPSPDGCFSFQSRARCPAANGTPFP